MSQRPAVLIRVNYMVEIPGYAGRFTTPDLRFDQESKRLLVRTTDGVVSFGMDDTNINVRAVDLDVPTIIRQQQKDDGWETMTMARLVTLIHHEDLLTDKP